MAPKIQRWMVMVFLATSIIHDSSLEEERIHSESARKDACERKEEADI